MKRSFIVGIIHCTVVIPLAAQEVLASYNAASIVVPERADGYRGIWYSNQPSNDQYRYKYSGGLGTYCAKHLPLAQYALETDKTFFVYGGTKGVGHAKPLLIMVSYFDHKSGLVPRPAVLMAKGTDDAHHNPTLVLDDRGFLWIFVSAHGKSDGFIWKSTDPYSIDRFELVMQREFTYPQPKFFTQSGFVFLFTKYTGGRELYISTSSDGRSWSPDRKLAGFAGHYQVSEQHGERLGTAFNWHPPKVGLNGRTNLYYMESKDCGETWTTADGRELSLPLSEADNPALVHDYQNEGRLVYMKDLNFDAEGNPVILTLVSRGYESGPANGPRIWTLAHWRGTEWAFKTVTESDHNYDMGSLYIETDGTWRLIAPTEPGPQVYCTGGEIALWISTDAGECWHKVNDLTGNSEYNHTYVRRPRHAHPDFYAFWADGNAFEPSESRLYFCDRTGDRVWILPTQMTDDFEPPVRYTKPEK